MCWDVLSYKKIQNFELFRGMLKGGIMVFKIPTCIIVSLPLEEIIPGTLFKKNVT